jgi:hypothetical protein
MHCECEAYVLQKRMLNLQFTGFGKRREHKLRGDILGQRPHGRILPKRSRARPCRPAPCPVLDDACYRIIWKLNQGAPHP